MYKSVHEDSELIFDEPREQKTRVMQEVYYKGAIYETIGETLHTETEEKLIIYYAVNKPEQLFARPAGMFFETVDIDGKILPRFEPLA